MAYQFKRGEALSRAVKRVFAEELSWAVGQLGRSNKRAEAVHEARKSVKKIRGLLSLVARPLGPLYKREDRYFREAGILSEFRDSTVILETFDGLAGKHPEGDAETIKEMRTSLRRSESHKQAEKTVSGEVIRLLEKARLPGEAWPLGDLQFEMLVPAMTATYQGGRKALKRAQKAASAENFHDFRKKVKEHWYHLRLFEISFKKHAQDGRGGKRPPKGLRSVSPLMVARIGAFCASDADLKKRVAALHELETWLGDEHNLSVLRARLNGEIETNQDRQKIREVINWLDTESESLRQRALAAGEQLYGGKASAFAERLAQLTPAAKRPAGNATPLRARSAAA